MPRAKTDYAALRSFAFRTYGKIDCDSSWGQRFNYPEYESCKWRGPSTAIDLQFLPDYKGSYYGQLAYMTAGEGERPAYVDHRGQ